MLEWYNLSGPGLCFVAYVSALQYKDPFTCFYTCLSVGWKQL